MNDFLRKVVLSVVVASFLLLAGCCLCSHELKKAACTTLANKMPCFRLGKIQDVNSISVRPKSIMIIEVNTSHGECIPGYAKYFLDLGYNVDVLVMRQNADCCSCFPVKYASRMRIFVHRYVYKLFTKEPYDIFRLYDYVVLNSSCDYAHKDFDLAGFKKLKNVLFVTHSLGDVKKGVLDGEQLQQRIITLGNFDRGTMVNPHYFGALSGHVKQGKTRFVVVGGIQALRKNYQLLADAISILHAYNLDFMVTVVGDGTMPAMADDISMHVCCTGRLNYAKMYAEVEQADFLLFLLDPYDARHEEYITDHVTGSAQLVYGFHVVPLVSRKFAAFYGFDSGNALVYEDNDLAQAMLEAVYMSQDVYGDKRKNIRILAQAIYEQSAKNISLLLTAMKKECAYE